MTDLKITTKVRFIGHLISYIESGGLIHMDNFNIVLANMPTTIKAYTVSNIDGSYTIVVNARLSSNQQRLSCYHEMQHINNNDYDKKMDVGLLEIYAHQR